MQEITPSLSPRFSHATSSSVRKGGNTLKFVSNSRRTVSSVKARWWAHTSAVTRTFSFCARFTARTALRVVSFAAW